MEYILPMVLDRASQGEWLEYHYALCALALLHSLPLCACPSLSLSRLCNIVLYVCIFIIVTYKKKYIYIYVDVDVDVDEPKKHINP